MRDIEHALCVVFIDCTHTSLSRLCKAHFMKHVIQASIASSYGLASVFLNLQSSHAYGGVVSDPIEGAQYNERPLLVLRNAAGA